MALFGAPLVPASVHFLFVPTKSILISIGANGNPFIENEGTVEASTVGELSFPTTLLRRKKDACVPER